MSSTTLNLTPDLYQYLLNHSLREPVLLQQLREETQQLVEANMQISPEQGQFMAMLVQLLQAKKTLDIGTFTGYSALVVALALPEDGRVITCDIDPRRTTVARKFWEKAGVGAKIDFRLAPALETLDDLLATGEGDSFDFIFIDADKENYLPYYEKSLMLLRKGGLIAIDNVLWGGRVADVGDQDNSTRHIRALNDHIRTDERVKISLLPIGDGLTLAMK